MGLIDYLLGPQKIAITSFQVNFEKNTFPLVSQ